MTILDKETTHNWYALYTKPRAEKKIYEAFGKLGIEAYLPLRKELRVWSDRKKWIEAPVISSYIFVRVSKDDFWRVFEANGVVAYVSVDRKAVVIPNSEMDAMRKAVSSKLSLNVEASTVQRGQTITITSGPLKGIKGEVVEIQGAKKFYLRISHINCMLVVDLNSE